MFEPKEKPKHQRMLEAELIHALNRLNDLVATSEDYTKTLRIVERLNEMVDNEKPEPVSKNTLLTVGANLLGIAMIIKHESLNVITSKALGFVIRTR